MSWLSRWMIVLWTAAILVALTGCAGGSVPLSAQEVPEAFSLSIYKRTTDSRHTYMTLSRDGELAFGGGRAAMHRMASPIVTLTPEQRQAVWAIVVEHDLLHASGQAFAKAHDVAYEVEIRHRPGQFTGKSFRVVDDHVPQGVQQLHDLLFEIQGQVQYQPPPLPAADNR